MTGRRVEWIDMAKAIGIVAIVWGHTIYGAPRLAMWVYEFHVPLFVALSGVTLSAGSGGFVGFLGRRTRSILVPYLVWGLLSIVGVATLAAVAGSGAAGRDTDLLPNVRALLWGSPDGNRMDWNTPLWFLPAIFLMAIVTYPLLIADRRVGRGGAVLWVGAAAALVIAVVWVARWSVGGLPWAADSAVVLLPWYLAGAALGPRARTLRPPSRHRPAWWAGATLLLVSSVGFYLAASTATDYTVPTTGEPWLYYPGAAAGVLGWCLVALLWSPRWGVALGRRSLAVLVTHRPLLGVLQVAVPVTAVHLVGSGSAADLAVAAQSSSSSSSWGSPSTWCCGRDCRGCSA